MFKKLSKNKTFKKLQKKYFPALVIHLMRLVLKTCRIELIGVDNYLEKVKLRPSIIMLWHNRVALGPNFFGDYMPRDSNYTAYVSNSRDGEWLALTTEYYPNGYTIRVPKTGKHESLRQFIKTLKKSVLLITPDGPTGPRYKIKPGVIMAAKAADAQIFPFSWSASKYWRLRSWDKLIIPKPFSKIKIGYGEPFSIPKGKEISLEEKITFSEYQLSKFKDFITRKL